MNFFQLSLLIVLGYFGANHCFSQSAQNAIYHRILITGNIPEIRKQMGIMGMETEHGHWSNGKAIVEVSSGELEMLKKAGISYSVLIQNVSEYYANRAKSELLNSEVQKVNFQPNCNNFISLKKPQWFHLGSMGGFYTLQEMIQIIDSMQSLYPNLITVKQPISSTLTIEGKPIYYVKISDNPNIDENEPEVLYTALHHAREPLSLSQLIFFMWYILENYPTDPEIQYLINHAELFFIPCLNPDGYEYNSQTNPSGGGMFRKNRRLNADNSYGVDLNRNYGYMWGIDNWGSSPTPSASTFRGTGPFSEPETKAIKHFCENRSFVNALNAHSYGNLLIFPWGYQLGFFTPDSAWFNDMSEHLCLENRYHFGTADQTVQYVVNGSSDDWMYGEQTTKSKMMALTPESGSVNDGFWPSPSNIIELCRQHFYLNLKFGLSALQTAVTTDIHDHFISTNGFIKYSIRREGIQGNGHFTVSLVPLLGITSVGTPHAYTLNINQTITDSLSFTLSSGLNPGQPLRYILRTHNGIYAHDDTIQKVFGTPITVLSDLFNGPASAFNMNGWGYDNSFFHSPPSSISESPGGNYNDNIISHITTSQPINLTLAVHAHLQYFIRYSTEKTFDGLKVLVSANGGQSWNALCGKYSSVPIPTSQPYYEGKQHKWVKEEIDLSDYIGQQILLRFEFSSDFNGNDEGFNLDDILTRIIVQSTHVSNIPTNLSTLSIFPNPGNGNFHLLKNPDTRLQLYLYASDGKKIFEKPILPGTAETTIQAENLPCGIYLIRITDESGSAVTHRYIRE